MKDKNVVVVANGYGEYEIYTPGKRSEKKNKAKETPKPHGRKK